jgi:hypothetical protein
MSAKMRLGHRYFVVDGASPSRLSQRVFNAVYVHGTERLPQFAGRTVLLIGATYTLKGRKPARIVRLDCSRLRFTTEGAIDEDHRNEALHLAVNRVGPAGDEPSASKENIIDASRQFDERRWRQHHPEVPGPVLAKILRNLFPGV